MSLFRRKGSSLANGPDEEAGTDLADAAPISARMKSPFLDQAEGGTDSPAPVPTEDLMDDYPLDPPREAAGTVAAPGSAQGGTALAEVPPSAEPGSASEPLALTEENETAETAPPPDPAEEADGAPDQKARATGKGLGLPRSPFLGEEAGLSAGAAAEAAGDSGPAEAPEETTGSYGVPSTRVHKGGELAERPVSARMPIIEWATPIVLWASLATMLGGVGYAILSGAGGTLVFGLFLAGLFAFGTMLAVAGLTGAYSPLLFMGIVMRRLTLPRRQASDLAGEEVLAALGLAESILDADVDARVVTRPDGVVVYANAHYRELSREAGLVGATGLPPRIERFFGGATTESSKIFRLARAARSARPADEIITQVMGPVDAEGNTVRRRFEVSVRPLAGTERRVGWRLRELEVEQQSDRYRAAYAHYPRPVLGIERSGTLTWINEAAQKALGVGTTRDIALEDIVLGESREIVDALWGDPPEEIEGRVRLKSAGSGHTSVVFTPFVRAGVGEGFVCVEMQPKTTEQGAQMDSPFDVADAPIGVAVVEGDLAGDARLTTVNRLFADAFGATTGTRLADALPPDAHRELLAAIRSKTENKAVARAVDVQIGEGANARNLSLTARQVKRRRGAYGPRQYVLYMLDISRQRRLEEDHAHGERLKNIGKIAGTVAHDFNNFLQAILGATEFLQRRHPAGDPSYEDLVAIRENAQRARNLTSNLLAFSRKQTLQSEIIQVTELVSDFTPFVQRYVTEKVKVAVDHGRQIGAIKADKSQLEVAIMNLAVNARDAMHNGGTLTIRTRRVPADGVAAYGYAVLEETDHVLIEISDTGSGVPEDIAEKIFEPFFTTKGEGKGTGLGLSTVHGIIGQLGGRIFLHNRPGEGATFRVFMPALSEEEVAASLVQERKSESRSVDDLTGKGRILVVEDEDGVRNIVVRALAMAGYDIVEACDGEEALELLEDDNEKFDVVLSDIMMPEVDGPTLIQEAGEKLSGAKIIFMSGYAEAAMQDKLSKIDGARYLQKPFTLTKVAEVVKKAMLEG